MKSRSISTERPPRYRRSAPIMLSLTMLCLLPACTSRVECDDVEVIDKMLDLAKRGVVKDLAAQCASRLYGKIPTVAAKCPADGADKDDACATACREWAETNVTATADKPETLFRDETVTTRRCRVAVRFDVAYDGGQVVNANITYLAAPRTGGAQVALSE
jgi:hypothetical protein